MTDAAEEGRKLYRDLPTFATGRDQELRAMLTPFVDITDRYGELVSRAVLALGRVPPRNRQDAIVRDLLADVFDFLYEWRRPLLEGRVHVGYPLGRRSYESLSLLSAVLQDKDLATRWDSGKQIGNSQIRSALTSLPFYEDETSLRELYSFFSKGSHPNRDLVSERFLGEGNEYVLGSIGRPSLVLVLDSSISLLGLWFWFGALVAYVAREPLASSDAVFGSHYLETARDAQEISRWLADNYNRLLEQDQSSST